LDTTIRKQKYNLNKTWTLLHIETCCNWYHGISFFLNYDSERTMNWTKNEYIPSFYLKIHMKMFLSLFFFISSDVSISTLFFWRWIYAPGATAMRRAMQLLRWRSDTIAKSLLFCCVATIVFSSYCLVILIFVNIFLVTIKCR
jgi:hypothetical protein